MTILRMAQVPTEQGKTEIPAQVRSHRVAAKKRVTTMHSRQALGITIAALIGLLSNRIVMGQAVQPVLSLNNNIGNALVSDPMSFGRGEVTLHFFVSAS